MWGEWGKGSGVEGWGMKMLISGEELDYVRFRSELAVGVFYVRLYREVGSWEMYG